MDHIMNIFIVAVSVLLFLSSFLAFAFAFAVPEEFAAVLFFAGILAASASFAIPIHLLGRRDR
jgi:hypothetical protein